MSHQITKFTTMKEIRVQIICDLICVEYCNVDKDFYDEYYATYGMENIEALYINGNTNENLVKQKGKYIKTKEFFHNLWKEDGEHPLPVEVHVRTFNGDYPEYTIKLEDDEEFDIKKLQLVKSDYECEPFPYFIIADYIMYDGKKINEDGGIFDIGIEGRYCDEHTVDEDNMY